jgi:hypothetical protein
MLSAILILTFEIGGALTDLDWMVVSYRYSEWHRSMETWEFCPFLKMNWWLAYEFTILRAAAGFFILGCLLTYWSGKNGERKNVKNYSNNT